MIITFGDTTQPGQVPASITGSRARTIVFRNTGPNTVYWGWEKDVNARTDGNPKRGVTLLTMEGMVIDGKDMLSTNIYFAAAAGGNTIDYTLNL